MESIGKYVDDPTLKKILKETAGIGTQATRANIIELLLKRAFITRNKKQIKSTEKGRMLVDLLPKVVKDPATTALWEQKLEDVVHGALSLGAFLDNQRKNLDTMLDALANSGGSQIRAVQLKKEPLSAHNCSSCDKLLLRKKSKGKNRYFWGCTGYPECKVTLPDFNGKPGSREAANQVTEISCEKCKVGYLAERKGKYGVFYGCTKYPECKYITKKISLDKKLTTE